MHATSIFLALLLALAAGPAPNDPDARKAPARKSGALRLQRFQVPAGTALLLKLRTPLDSASSDVNGQVEATLWSPVVQNGVELVPEGSVVIGKITSVARASLRAPIGSVTFTFSIVEHAETGSRAAISTRPIVIEASPTPSPGSGATVRLLPRDAVLAEGSPFVAITIEPLLVIVPK